MWSRHLDKENGNPLIFFTLDKFLLDLYMAVLVIICAIGARIPALNSSVKKSHNRSKCNYNIMNVSISHHCVCRYRVPALLVSRLCSSAV